MASVRTEESKGLEVRSDRYIRAMLEHVQRTTGTKYFIETGTEYGDTARWAAGVFDHVVTMEASQVHYDAARPILTPLRNVTQALVDSPVGLRHIDDYVPPDQSVMYYLDAHWSTGPVDDDYYGRYEPNPLLREIAAIQNRTKLSHVSDYVFIDDVRMFIYPWYVPKGSTQVNPSLRDIVLALPSYEIAVYADCFMCLPLGEARDIIQSWRKSIAKTDLDILT